MDAKSIVHLGEGFIQTFMSGMEWSDFRLTKYSAIAQWWEIISCAFLLVSFQFLSATISESTEPKIVESELKSYLSKHRN